MPDWLDVEAWSAYVAMRRSMGRRAPFTDLAEKRTLHELEKLQAEGHPNGEVLWQSVIAAIEAYSHSRTDSSARHSRSSSRTPAQSAPASPR